MNNNHFEMTSLAGRELSEEELMLIQGGSWLGDLGRAVSNGVKAVGDAISDGVNAVGHAVGQGARAVAEGLVNRALADVRRQLSRWF
jgi:hypothetical protein